MTSRPFDHGTSVAEPTLAPACGRENGTPAARRTAAVILPYAVSIRDFVHSGVLARLLAMQDVRLVIYTLNPELPELAQAREAGVEIRPFAPYKDSRAESLLKRLYLYFFADHFVYIEQMLATKPLHRLVARTLGGFRRAIGTRRLLGVVERLMLVIFRGRNLPRTFSDRPDLVIATRSLMNSLDYGVIAEARACGISILTIANSWDNFTTKGFFPFRAEQILVWNRKMVEELEEIFDVPTQDVAVVGYPRGQTLRTLARGSDPAAYLESLGHGQFRRFILYSASYSELTRIAGEPEPLEYQVMAQVAARLEAMLPADVCILLRMHPFSDTSSQVFSNLQRSFVYVPGRKDKYVERVMGLEDEVHLARQIALSECVLSMASTMSIDALSLDKAVLNIGFDPRPGIPYIQSISRFYAFNHFRDLVEIVKLPVAANPDEVVCFVEEILAGDTAPRGDIGAFNTYYVPESSAAYAGTVSEFIRRTLGLPIGAAAGPASPSIQAKD